MKGGMPDHDLKALGEVLEQGQAGVLVVYATNIANQVAANVKAVSKYVSQEIDARPTRSPGSSGMPRRPAEHHLPVTFRARCESKG
jgi:hypothetical protein